MEWARVHLSKLSSQRLSVLKILRHVANCYLICLLNRKISCLDILIWIIVFDHVQFESETEALVLWRYSITFHAPCFYESRRWTGPIENKWKTRLTWTKWGHLQAIMNLIQNILWNVYVSFYIHEAWKLVQWHYFASKIWPSALQKSYISKVWERSVLDYDVYIWSKLV